MADLTPMEPGDVPYPQYSVVTTIQKANSADIVKGRMYTLNANANLITVSSDFTDGIYQAMVTDTETGVNSLQVLGTRSRIIVIAGESLAVGADVVWDFANNKVVKGLQSDVLYVGRVFSIYTRNSDGTKKEFAADNELMVVDMVSA